MTEPAAGGHEVMLIDAFLPEYQVTRAEHVVVDAPPAVVYRALRSLDFHAAHTPLINAALRVRDLPMRARGDRREAFEPPTPASTRLADLDQRAPWVLLGEVAGREIAFGAVGKFWQPVVEWRWVPAEAFARFHEPGYGKTVAGLSVRPYGEARSLVSYETRTGMTDLRSWLRFRPYWRLVGPFVGMVERATLRAVRMSATGAGGGW